MWRCLHAKRGSPVVADLRLVLSHDGRPRSNASRSDGWLLLDEDSGEWHPAAWSRVAARESTRAKHGRAKIAADRTRRPVDALEVDRLRRTIGSLDRHLHALDRASVTVGRGQTYARTALAAVRDLDEFRPDVDAVTAPDDVARAWLLRLPEGLIGRTVVEKLYVDEGRPGGLARRALYRLADDAFGPTVRRRDSVYFRVPPRPSTPTPPSTRATGEPLRRIREKVIAAAGPDPKCVLCDEPIDVSLAHPDPRAATIEHVIPISQGGAARDLENLALAHRTCNVSNGRALALAATA